MKAGTRALATRCPACGTVFRVVPDQLRVSEGWVRCGRCTEVFNAPETLVDMDTGARQRLPEAERQTLVATPDSPANSASLDLDFNNARPAPEPDVEHAVEPIAASVAEPAGLRDTPPGASPFAHPDALPDLLPDPRAEPDDRPPPSFMRRAEQAARWRRPRVRLALGAGIVVTSAVLAAQVIYTYRDLTAARWPALQPALAQACLALRCELGAPRLLDGLAVQSSGLSRVDASDLYRLAVTLRNQADIDLALPAIDLSLTDSQGRLVLRRVLPLSALAQTAGLTPGITPEITPGIKPKQTPDRLGAGRELVLQATLQVAGAPAAEPVAGYTIVLFYP